MTILQNSELTEFLQIFDITNLSPKPFSPFVFYNKDGDSLEFYISSNDFYSERIDDYLTLLLDMDSDVMAGFIIKNIKQICEKVSASQSAWEFVVNDGNVKLHTLITAFLVLNEKTREDNKIDKILVREYKKVVNIIEEKKIDKVSLHDLDLVGIS
ncbi:MAG: hypothetical protein LBE12_01455 [Planctomycetaceae bacterium]|jgi:hypothetical protein|nr:hypothetical protein [Planctomycetaceae bacterium]